MNYLENLYRNAPTKVIGNARELRHTMTKAEKHLWERIRRRQIKSVKFRNQHAIDHFVLDFYCHELLLGIEVDGAIHEITEVKEYDDGRTIELANYGIRILRFTNEDVFNHIDKVIIQIENTIDELKSKL